jgi:hypothetical protein
VTGSVGSVTGNVGGNVTGSVGSVASGGITSASFAANAINAAKLDPDVTTELQAGLATASALATVDTVVDAIKAVTDLLPDGGALTSLGGEISDIVAALSIHTGTAQAGAAGTITLDTGASSVNDYYNDTLVLITSGTGAGQVRHVSDYVGSTRVATIKPNWTTTPDNTSVFRVLPEASPWDHVTADHADSGSTGESLGAAGAAGDPWTTALPGSYSSGQAGKIIGDNINATISSRATPAQVNTEADTAIADAGLATGANLAVVAGYLDTEVAAIKAKTDQLTFTVSNRVDSTTQAGVSTLDAAGVRTAVGLGSANLDTQLSGINAKTTNLPTDPADQSAVEAAITAAAPTASSIRAAVGLASANLDTQIGDLPTNAELATSQAAADDATLAAIAARPSAAAIATAVLAAATANPIDANLQEINDVVLTGDGSSIPWGPV